jgi:hypothetical protein
LTLTLGVRSTAALNSRKRTLARSRVGRSFDELLPSEVLQSEGPDDCLGRGLLLDQGCQTGLLLLDRNTGGRGPRPEQPRAEQGQWQPDQRHQRQAPVEGQQQRGADQAAEQVRGEIGERIEDGAFECEHVARKAGDDVAQARASKVVHRQTLEVVEEIQADVVEHPRTESSKDIVAPDAGGRRGDKSDHESAENQCQQRPGVLCLSSVDEQLEPSGTTTAKAFSTSKPMRNSTSAPLYCKA